ncbi:MAG: alpha/beta hydrolase [Vicinamibacteria bacterium]
MRLPMQRSATVGLLAVVAACASGCGQPSSSSAIEVRWPATSLLIQGEDHWRDGVVADAPAPPTREAGPAPGVKVREGEAHDLTYVEVILGEADFDDALPLVVLLHGRGDRPRVPGGPFGRVSTPMRLVMPRGPLRLGAGYAWVYPSITHGRHDLLAAALRRRTHHLAALIDSLSRTLPTLGRPVVAGFSQGALLTFSLALHRPDVVGQALPLAGWVPPDLMPAIPGAPARRVPIRAVHGAADPRIPVGPTRDVVSAPRALEWDVELLEFEGVGHVVSPEMNATFEGWLEDALRAQAPELAGRGPRMLDPEADSYAPWEPLEPETIEAIERLELSGPEPPPDEEDAGASADEAGEGGEKAPEEGEEREPRPPRVPPGAH